MMASLAKNAWAGTPLGLAGWLTMHFTPNRQAGLDRLTAFLPQAGRAYADTRNHDTGPGRGGARTNVSQLSPWLHAGLLSEAEVVAAVLGRHSPSAAEKFIAELFWRVYFKGYLEQRPTIWRSYCIGRDAALTALDNNAGLHTAYAQAVEGRTGIAAFDHWARELVTTGYLHNHARMWFASIWIFTLRLDWHLGADFFLRHLVDGDAASNTLSWRWVGGLHTHGKTYLARADNIARYTEGHPDGPLVAEGLAQEALPLEEAREHRRRTLDLPTDPLPGEPYALILHDEAASHVPLALPIPPALIIGATRPAARSPGEVGNHARAFVQDAVRGGMAQAASAFGCAAREWGGEDGLAAILTEAGIARVALPYLPTGWTRDALMPDLAPLIEQGCATVLLGDLPHATWPHAKAGFFGVSKQIDAVLREIGIGE
jgi:hypothetical protein